MVRKVKFKAKFKAKFKNRIDGDWAYSAAVHIMLAIVLAVIIYPFVFTVSTSLSASERLLKEGNVFFLPKGFTMDGYIALLNMKGIPRFYANTVLYAISGTALMLAVCCLTAYPLSVRRLPGKKAFLLMITVTLFFNGGLIPTYLQIVNMGMLDTFWAFIVPGAINAWNVIIFKTFFQQLPVELSDAAYMDGANEFVIFRKVILPLSAPIIATFAVFGLVAFWNDWFTPLIYFNSEKLQPMQLFLRKMLVNLEVRSIHSMSATLAAELIDSRPSRSAAVVITVLPIACIYPFFQKHFTKGILVGSLKG